MERREYKTCRNCGRHKDECGILSHQRLCSDCGRTRLEENIYGIATKTGIAYRRQLIGQVRAAVSDPRFVEILARAGAFPPVQSLDTTPERR